MPSTRQTASPLPDVLVEQLAVILAEALVNDVKQYPQASDIPRIAATPVSSPRGSDRKLGEPGART